MATKKKRNPNDATMRNIRAMKKRIEKLERQHSALLAEHGDLVREFARMNFRVLEMGKK